MGPGTGSAPCQVSFYPSQLLADALYPSAASQLGPVCRRPLQLKGLSPAHPELSLLGLNELWSSGQDLSLLLLLAQEATTLKGLEPGAGAVLFQLSLGMHGPGTYRLAGLCA